MTALWASVAHPTGAAPAAVCADAPVDASDPSCEGWWTADERYVLRVAAAGGERWYVGELEVDEVGDELRGAGTPRPPREAVPPSRTMLVGRQRGRRTAPAPMRLHVRRPPRG